MHGPLSRILERDHARLDELLRRAVESPDAVSIAPYQSLRAGLLRHIAMEEQILFPAVRSRSDPAALALVEQLHADHAALATLLVPTPTHAILATIRGILAEHNPLEEGEGGLYELCERLAGTELDALVAQLEVRREVRLAKHVDKPNVHEHIARLLRARSATRRR